jgi:hypothetical protein
MKKPLKSNRAIRRRARKSTTAGAGGESFYDVLVREGILGGGKGLPRDLSTNPKYMEGFGGSANLKRPRKARARITDRRAKRK